MSRSPGSSLPPQNVARPNSSSLPPAPNRPAVTAPPFASGLAAAFSESQPVASLGALEVGTGLSLSALDGNLDGNESSPGSFGPPPSAAAAASSSSSGPASPSASSAAPSKARPKDVPLDLFAPPDADDAQFVVNLASDEIADRKGASTPPPEQVKQQVAAQSTPPTSPVLQRRAVPRPSLPPVLGVVAAEPPRWRFAAGVLIAIVLGFIPAHFVAAMRESSAFQEIDRHVTEVQLQIGAPDAPVPYERLDGFRREQEDRKRSERRTIALTSMLIWAGVGALCAYVWFRRIPWDR